MKIKEIIVGAGRVFNHPLEDYSNLRPSLTIHAELNEDDDPVQVIKDLQAKAESMVEDHKEHLISSIRTAHENARIHNEIVHMENSIRNSQNRLDNLRSEQEQVAKKLNAWEGEGEQ